MKKSKILKFFDGEKEHVVTEEEIKRFKKLIKGHKKLLNAIRRL